MLTSIMGGLALGAIYGFIAVGYNLNEVSARALNFAHANLLVLGMFISLTLIGIGLPWWLVVPITGIAIGIVALIEEMVAIRPLSRLKSGTHSELVTTLGVAQVITGVIILVWGSEPIRVPQLVPGVYWDIAGGRIQLADVVLILVVVVLSILLILLLKKTRFGISALAQSEDRDAARLRGINVAKISMLGFAISGVMVGLAALSIGGRTYAFADLALFLGLKGFIAFTLGGVGSFGGALAGGFLLGLIEQIATTYAGAAWATVLTFVVFVLIVLIRPQGIFGSVKQRVV